MLAALRIDEYEDWVQFAWVHNIAFNRDDLHWGMVIADFRNANRGDGEMPARPADCMPYFDPFTEEISADDLFARLPGRIEEQ